MPAKWKSSLVYCPENEILPHDDRRGAGLTHTSPRSSSQLASTRADTAQKIAAGQCLKAEQKKSNEEEPGTKQKAVDQEIADAERLWWSEASERQVKELESVFGIEFERTARKIRADIDIHQDRIESLLEAERKHRTQEVNDIRQELENHKVFISELREQITAKRAATTQALSEECNGMLELMTRLQSDLESTRAETTKCTRCLSEWETNRADSDAKTAAIEDLCKDLAAADKQRQLEITRIDKLVKEIGKDFEVARQQVVGPPSKEDLQNLRTLVLESTENFGNGIEEVSASIMVTEQKLMVELEAHCRKAQEMDAKRSKEDLDAVSVNIEKLAKQIEDECQQRTLEASVLKTRLDAAMGQLEILQSRHSLLSDELQVTSNKLAEPRAEQALKEDADLIRSQVEALRTELSRVERGFREELLEHSARTQRGAEGMATLDERIAAVQELAAQASSDLCEERTARSTAVAELLRFSEDAAGRAQAAFEALSIQKAVAQHGNHFEITEESLKQMLTQIIAAPELRSDLAMLRSGFQELDASCKQSSAAVARVEAEIAALRSECPNLHSLPQRLESLEQKARKHSTAAIRVDAIEAELQRAAQETDVRRLEQEVRLVAQQLVPLTSRTEAAEAEARQSSRNVIPMDARVKAVESEVQRLSRDGVPALATLDTLKSELKSMQARVVALQSAFAFAGLGAHSVSRSAEVSPAKVQKPMLPARRSASPGTPLRSQSPSRRSQAVAVDGTVVSHEERALPDVISELTERVHSLVSPGEPESDQSIPTFAKGSPGIPQKAVQTQATATTPSGRQASPVCAGGRARAPSPLTGFSTCTLPLRFASGNAVSPKSGVAHTGGAATLMGQSPSPPPATARGSQRQTSWLSSLARQGPKPRAVSPQLVDRRTC